MVFEDDTQLHRMRVCRYQAEAHYIKPTLEFYSDNAGLWLALIAGLSGGGFLFVQLHKTKLSACCCQGLQELQKRYAHCLIAVLAHPVGDNSANMPFVGLSAQIHPAHLLCVAERSASQDIAR